MSYKSTDHWERHKLEFLRCHDFNTRIESAIKAIEREMNSLSLYGFQRIARFKANTHLPLASAKRLVCLCLSNRQSLQFAPFYLYLANSDALEPPDVAVKALLLVKQELGW